MKYSTKSLLLWIFSVIFTFAIAYYQRTTGPTYTVKGKVNISGQEIKYKLIRTDTTSEISKFSEIKIKVTDEKISGKYIYKRYKSFDEWTHADLLRKGDFLIAYIPRQPMAGKMEYQILLNSDNKIIKLTEEPVVMRYKGSVPIFILIPHVLLMFLAMMLSTRTGLEVLIKGKNIFKYTVATLLLLIPGGMILGPIVQKFAFDVYWAGWPFGTDLTDTKTAVAFLAWIIAFFVLLKNKEKRKGFVLAASIILLIVYLVPHSLLGSEIDHTKTKSDKVEMVK